MSLKAGIVGLPNVGKSTLFNAITNSQVEAANYPFATIEPNVGVVELQDLRLNKIAKIINPKKIVYATFEFIDIAGLVKGASKGEGLGNQFLSNIKEVDAIIQVVRCFEDPNIAHVSKKIDPIDDINIINLELLLSDFETIKKIIKRTENKSKNTNDKYLIAEYNLALKLQKNFENEIPARDIELEEKEIPIIKTWNLLTKKPILYVANVDEKYVSYPSKSPLFIKLQNYLKNTKSQLIGISAQIEGEISQLDQEEKDIFLDELKIQESGLNKLTHSAFKLLNLSTYFTAGEQEVKAWTFKNGFNAPECAGIIHTDFKKGFIKAEVVSCEDFLKYEGYQKSKEAGKFRIEGKDYIVDDGDIMHFRFNV